ncbi:hypothetical protein LIER_36571 [Lithospermum erythrorhizon]|uniref:Uncharacterized protein n=1 Tax=Lithospermum erythrorhizon TaxID=34254 RepID=A0AAV3P892_LITER
MAHQTLLVPHIRLDTRNWTARITITEDIPAITCGIGSKLNILTDQEGNEVAAIIFGHHIPILVPLLRLFKVYDITNAQVKLVEPIYIILKNPFQWTLQRDTFIRPVLDIAPTFDYFLDGLTPFSIIARSSSAKLSSVDIME